MYTISQSIMKGVVFGLVVLFAGVSSLNLSKNAFPKDFKFGAATSAYQIEGAWDEDGRGTSLWDDYLHNTPNATKDNSNADVACDSYHRYEEDVALLKKLGANVYRFSISWPRILPYGTSQKINMKGVEYYVNLLKLLKANGIEPYATLYHWDLPLPLHQQGGWTNPDIVEYFGDYARICYKYFGEYVKYWVTINEPQSTCFLGYGGNKDYFPTAPAYELSEEGVYICAYTNAKAHALAYHIYQDEFKEKQNGKLSMAFVTEWYEPASESNDDDVTAQELAMQFRLGMFAHPIYKGNWPQVVIDRVGNRSAMEGLEESRLPAFTKGEIDYINGTYDWFGVNYYITGLTELQYKEDDLPGNASYLIDEGFKASANSSWTVSATSTWLYQVPWGLTKMLQYINNNYNRPEIIITENGWSENGPSLSDPDRIEYFSLHLSSILDAIYDYGINVIGYTHWSLLDNFEWSNGYTARFGLVRVDFTNENRTRTPKESFYWYQNVIDTRCLVETCINSSGHSIAPQLSFWKSATSFVAAIVFWRLL